MITYTVHQPPAAQVDTLDRAAALEFVRDGFSLLAALFAPLWMALHGMWLVLLAYAAIAAAAVGFVFLTGANAGWLGMVLAALHLLIGFEAGSLRRWTLERKGWHSIGTVGGRSTEECERRFFENWLPDQPLIDGSQLQKSGAGLAALAGQVGLSGGGRAMQQRWRNTFSRS